MQQALSWTDALMSAFTNALSSFATAIPKVLAFAVILIIGWVIASLLAKGVAMLLRKLHFNDIADKAGLTKLTQNAGVQEDASGLLALVAKWFVRIIALVTAFDALGLPAVSKILNDLLQWLPNLFVALTIMVIGGWAANAVAALVRGVSTTGQSSNPDLMVKIARTSVWVFTGIVAFSQLGIAANIVQILFSAIVGAAAIGAGLAIGLGGKDVAGEMLRKWYNSKE